MHALMYRFMDHPIGMVHDSMSMVHVHVHVHGPMDHGPWIKSTYFILIPRPAAWIHGLERFTIMNQVLEKPSQVYHVIMEPKDPRLTCSEFRSEPTEATERRSTYQPLIYNACTVRNRKAQPQATYKA